MDALHSGSVWGRNDPLPVASVRLRSDLEAADGHSDETLLLQLVAQLPLPQQLGSASRRHRESSQDFETPVLM